MFGKYIFRHTIVKQFWIRNVFLSGQFDCFFNCNSFAWRKRGLNSRPFGCESADYFDYYGYSLYNVKKETNKLLELQFWVLLKRFIEVLKIKKKTLIWKMKLCFLFDYNLASSPMSPCSFWVNIMFPAIFSFPCINADWGFKEPFIWKETSQDWFRNVEGLIN